jgi:hypothetical protein
MMRRSTSAQKGEHAMKRSNLTAWAVVALLALGACAAGSEESKQAAADGTLQQLLLGLWHGVIAPVMLVVEIINRFAPHALPWTVRFYESRNTGVIYDIGFYLGLAGGPSILFGGWSARR